MERLNHDDKLLNKLSDVSILICGQRYTSRTETLEKYFSKATKRLGVIGIAGLRQNQNCDTRLYIDGKIVKEFQMRGFYQQKNSPLYLMPVSLYFVIYILNFFRSQRKLASKFDIFIGVQTWATLLGVFLKKLGMVKSVVYYTIDYYTLASTPKAKIQTIIFRRLDRYCYNNSDIVWNLVESFSKDRRTDFQNSSFQDKQIYVPLTYSESLLINRDLKDIERHSIGFVGTLERGQGWEVFIKAVPIIKARFNDLKVHVFGDGPYRANITKLIREEHIEDSVVLHGFIQDEEELLQKLSRCAVGVAPYLPHRAKYAGLEAGKPKLYAFVGLPIVMTYTDEIESLLQKYKVGKTFKYDPESLANAIETVIADDEKLKQYKRNANEFAKRFTSEAIFPNALEKTLAFQRVGA